MIGVEADPTSWQRSFSHDASPHETSTATHTCQPTHIHKQSNLQLSINFCCHEQQALCMPLVLWLQCK